jgi:hypothetical protein
LEEEEAARADAQVLTMSRPDTGEQVLACTMRRGEAKRGELIAVAEPGGNAWAQGSGVRWQGGCECEQCRQADSHTCRRYNTKYRGLAWSWSCQAWMYFLFAALLLIVS